MNVINNIEIETIRKQADAWKTHLNESNQRGQELVKFVLCNEQWDGVQSSKRGAANKESLTFNECIKHLNDLKAQIREVEFDLNFAQINTNFECSMQELNAFRLVVENIALSKNTLDKLGDAGERCAEFGYSVAQMDYEYAEDGTLCKIPSIKVLINPTSAFFDINDSSETKTKGRFCGVRKIVSKQEFLLSNPSFKEKDLNYLKKDSNEVFDYWYRDFEMMDFTLLKTGVYKRNDLLNKQDKLMIETFSLDADNKPIELTKKHPVACIYYMRTCNEEIVIKPKKFPLYDLPLVYHFGFSVYSPDENGVGLESFPYAFYIKDPQKLHNYNLSQIATVCKTLSGDKWFMNKEHVVTKTAQENSRNINKLEGTILLDGDLSKIRREPGAEIPQTSLALAQLTKSSIDTIAGSAINNQIAEVGVVSGVALDKISKNLGIINVNFLSRHIRFVKEIGRLERQMIPLLYTEERQIIIDGEEGNSEAIIINQLLPSGEIKNNVKNLNNNFYFEIKAGPSLTMQKENTIKYLLEAYGIKPELLDLTADIFFRNMEFPDAQEVARRVAVNIDSDLIKYSQGKMSLEEYKKLLNDKQQKQMEQQITLIQNSPESKLAAAEHAKASVQSYDAQTKRLKAFADIEKNNNELHIKLAQLLNEQQTAESAQEIEKIRLQISQNESKMQELPNAQF